MNETTLREEIERWLLRMKHEPNIWRIDNAVADIDRLFSEHTSHLLTALEEKKKWYSGEGNEPIRRAFDEAIDLIKSKQ